MDLTALHPFLKTKADANKVVQILEGLNDGLFKESFNLESALAEKTSYDLKVGLEKTIQESGTSPANTSDLRTKLRSLVEEVTKLPVVHIILALSPSEESVNIIHDWFFENYKKIVLLDISIDKSIIAGSVISFNGRANDYSLATRVEQLV